MSSASAAVGRPSAATNRAGAPSLLVVDCGSVYTKVGLLGTVDGRYRLLGTSQAPTTAAPPHADLMHGIRAAVADLERLCGRALLSAGRPAAPGQAGEMGVDGVAVVVSAGGPLRLLAAGPGREPLSALIYRALGGHDVTIDPFQAAEPGPGAGSAEWERQVARLREAYPHGVLVVGTEPEGPRAGPPIADAARALAAWMDAAFAAAAGPAAAPKLPVIFAGTPEDAALMRAELAGRASVHAVESLSPTTLAPLGQAVAALYEGAVLRRLPGYDAVRALGPLAPQSPAASLASVVQHLGQQYQTSVVGVDVGASATVLVGATAQGRVSPALHPEAGVGPGLGAILRTGGAANVLRWLEAPMDEGELREYAIGRMLRPRLVPTTARELELEHAFAREAIRLALRAPGSTLAGMYPVDVVLGTGGVLANAPSPGQAALVLLDGLQPRGISSLVLDRAQVAGTLGALAAVVPEAGAAVAEGDAVVAQLGSVISTFGGGAPGEPAVRVALDYGDGRRHVADVLHGTLVRLPLRAGERALLSLYPAPDVNIGLGPGQQARASDPLEGGLLGLVVDARGRPLALPADDAERRAKLAEWRRALGGVG